MQLRKSIRHTNKSTSLQYRKIVRQQQYKAFMPLFMPDINETALHELVMLFNLFYI